MAVPNVGGPRAIVSVGDVCGNIDVSHNNVHLVVCHFSDRLAKAPFGVCKSKNVDIV